MGLLTSKKTSQKCSICGQIIGEKSLVDDLCATCYRQCVYFSSVLRYLQNTSIEKLTCIESAAAIPTNPVAQPMQEKKVENVVSDRHDIQETAKPLTMKYSVIRNKTGERFILFEQINRIGKSAEMADIVISDNNTLSRCHAVLEKTAQGIVLSDKGSKNGTRFGGERLPSGKRVLLTSGDVFVLSNEKFTLLSEQHQNQTRENVRDGGTQ